jgi:hypothetical protein
LADVLYIAARAHSAAEREAADNDVHEVTAVAYSEFGQHAHLIAASSARDHRRGDRTRLKSKPGATTMTRKRVAQSPEYAVSDEAAAYIADALMEIALQFEASHFAQIRRHYESITPERDDDRWQLDLFGEHQPR